MKIQRQRRHEIHYLFVYIISTTSTSTTLINFHIHTRTNKPWNYKLTLSFDSLRLADPLSFSSSFAAFSVHKTPFLFTTFTNTINIHNYFCYVTHTHNPYQMNLDQSSQRIPSIIADKILSHPQAQGHLLLQLLLPNPKQTVDNQILLKI